MQQQGQLLLTQQQLVDLLQQQEQQQQQHEQQHQVLDAWQCQAPQQQTQCVVGRLSTAPTQLVLLVEAGAATTCSQKIHK
jgi:hypothetical protein